MVLISDFRQVLVGSFNKKALVPSLGAFPKYCQNNCEMSLSVSNCTPHTTPAQVSVQDANSQKKVYSQFAGRLRCAAAGSMNVDQNSKEQQ